MAQLTVINRIATPATSWSNILLKLLLLFAIAVNDRNFVEPVRLFHKISPII